MYNDKLLTYLFKIFLPYVPLGSSDVGTLFIFFLFTYVCYEVVSYL